MDNKGDIKSYRTYTPIIAFRTFLVSLDVVFHMRLKRQLPKQRMSQVHHRRHGQTEAPHPTTIP